MAAWRARFLALATMFLWGHGDAVLHGKAQSPGWVGWLWLAMGLILFVSTLQHLWGVRGKDEDSALAVGRVFVAALLAVIASIVVTVIGVIVEALLRGDHSIHATIPALWHGSATLTFLIALLPSNWRGKTD